MRRIAFGLVLASLGACDTLDKALTVEPSAEIDASALEVSQNAQLLVQGAVADFECALGAYIVVGGLIGNELEDSQTGQAQHDYDRRSIFPALTWYAENECGTRIGVYTPLAIARWAADNALDHLEAWSDTEVSRRSELIARAAAYSGYAHVLIGEGFCEAAFDAGPQLDRAAIFRRAEQRFTRALDAAQQANVSDLLNMARVGRARARLNLGRLADAAADARLVPETYTKNAAFSAGSLRTENTVFAMNTRDNFASVARNYRNLTFKSVPDVRVPVVNTGRSGQDRRTIVWSQNKYANESAPIPFARGAEAQLIIAEVEGGATAVDIINRLHAKAGLPPFSSSDAGEIRQQVIEERARELFLESQHLGDFYRYTLPFEPPAGAPFLKGGFYGTVRCMPMPDLERLNNPTLKP